MEYKYTGIILNKWDVGETDRIYAIYTLEGGKIKSLAKGVRRAQSKLASSLENITLSDIAIARSRGLGKITGSIVEQNFNSLKRNCDALLETFIALGAFDKLVDYENPDQEVFYLLKSYLEAVDSLAENNVIEKFSLLRLGFMVKLLDALGYSIEVTICAHCGGSLSETLLTFSAQHGGFLCAECGKVESGSNLVRVNTIKMLRLFLQNDLKNHAKIKATLEDCDNVRLVVDDFIRWNA